MIDLKALRATLADKNVPVDNRTLSLDSRSLRVVEQNTTLLYFIGTIGPWLLVLLIVWFFIVRQMRSPGGSGGVLSFGRSRGKLYAQEDLGVTFSDVAGIDEAVEEVREVGGDVCVSLHCHGSIQTLVSAGHFL